MTKQIKIAKLLLLHVLVHACTKKDLINITFDFEFSLFHSLPLFILELSIHLILVKPILLSPMSIRFPCLSLASFHWWKVKACESSKAWPQNQCEPVKVHLKFSSVLNRYSLGTIMHVCVSFIFILLKMINYSHSGGANIPRRPNIRQPQSPILKSV